MSFESCKTFVHLQNTNWDIFDEFRELSDPPIDSNVIFGDTLQNGAKVTLRQIVE